MPEVPIDPQRRPLIEALLAQLRPGDPGAIADLDVPGDPIAVAAAVDESRLADSVAALASSPRHVSTHPEGLRRAIAYVEGGFSGAGLAPRRVEATFDGIALPSIYVTVPPAAGVPRPTPTVLLVAHYDTVPDSPGADDNASGVAALLEVARVLPPGVLPGAVVLAAVPFEEGAGLAGSRALAAALSARDDVRLLAAISAEMVGFVSDNPRLEGDAGNDLLLVGYPGTEALVETVCAASVAFGAGAVRGVAAPEVFADLERSDHAAFAQIGVPAAMATDGAEYRNPHYHQPGDVPDTLDVAFLAGSTRTLTVGLMALTARLTSRPG